MNEQSSNNESLDHCEARRQRREERLADPSRAGVWVAGFILILVGVALLMRSIFHLANPLENWWAFFILIPAVGAFDTALRTYRKAGNQWTAPARGSLLVGIVLTLVTLVFLFNIGWTYLGPALIILAGLGILFTGTTGKKE